MPSAIDRDLVGNLGGSLKVVSLLDNLNAEGAHGGIFFNAVSVGNDNRRWNAVVTGGKSNRLTVIASSGGGDSGWLVAQATELFEVYQTSAHFECTSRSVVFVLHPDWSADARFQ